MAPRLRIKGLKRVLAAQITIDESTGVALGQEQRGDEAVQKGFWYTGIGVFVFWNLFLSCKYTTMHKKHNLHIWLYI
jgi:predicted branched-subunit amino acid permease